MTERVVVVGGGIVGVSIALHLMDRGVPVCLVERDAHPQGASAASFAAITAMDEPSKDLYLLKTMGVTEWKAFSGRLGDVGLRHGGEIRWAETDEAAKTLEHQIEQAQARGYPVRLILENELHKLLPNAKPVSPRACSYAPRDGQAEPTVIIEAARRALIEAGAEMVHGRASLMVEPDRMEVRVSERKIEAGTVVLATGAETTQLAERLGWEVPMSPSPGLLAITSPVEHITNATVYVAPRVGTSIHLRQQEDGRVIVGERSQDWVVENPSEEHAQELIRQAASSFPQLVDAELEHFSLEWRPMPADRMPIVGPAPGLPSLYFATMHSGVTLAPVVGRLIAEEISEHRSQTRLEPFRLTRFAERRAEVEQDVEKVFAGTPDLFLG